MSLTQAPSMMTPRRKFGTIMQVPEQGTERHAPPPMSPIMHLIPALLRPGVGPRHRSRILPRQHSRGPRPFGLPSLGPADPVLPPERPPRPTLRIPLPKPGPLSPPPVTRKRPAPKRKTKRRTATRCAPALSRFARHSSAVVAPSTRRSVDALPDFHWRLPFGHPPNPA
jgi:hypothetical protein